MDHLRQLLDTLVEGSGEETASLRLQRKLGRMLVPSGSTRERLLRLLAATRRVLRTEGVGSVARRAFRKLSRRPANAAPGLPGTQQPAAERPLIEQIELGLERLEDLEWVENHYLRMAGVAGERSPVYVPRDTVHLDPNGTAVKAIAFYVPQDGACKDRGGPPEWTSIARATPQFVGHYQPHLPDALGFYDLRVPGMQELQTEIARQYGIYGFCFYYGCERGLESNGAIRSFAENPKIDTPFCLMLSSLRSSSGSEGAKGPEDCPEQDRDFLDLLPYLKNPRYIRFGDYPALIVRSSSMLTDPKAIAQRWRDCASENGLPGLYLVVGREGLKCNPKELGFDAALDIPPSDSLTRDHLLYDGRERVGLRILNPEYKGRVYSFPSLLSRQIRPRLEPEPALYESAIVGWDTTPFAPNEGATFAYSSPSLLQHWVFNLCERALEEKQEGFRFVFINAWNNWAEGAHLEPDCRSGFANLAAVRRSLDLTNRIAASQTANSDEEIATESTLPEGEQKRVGSLSGVEPFPDFRYKFKIAPKAPIFVHQIGRVGSTSVEDSLSRAGMPEVFQVHVLTNLENSIRNHLKAEPEAKAALAHLEYCRELRAWMDSSEPDVMWRVITMVREPVGRNVSAFFQGLTTFIPEAEARLAAGDLTVEEVRAVFLGMFRHDLLDIWYPTQFEPVYGIDVFSKPYDFERGFQTYEKGRSRVLMIRREDLRRSGDKAIGEFVGLENFHISTENRSEDMAYSKLVKQFKKLALPESYVDWMYGGRVAQHFYTKEELANFRSRWTQAQG